MKRFVPALVAMLALGMATLDADAARRFGGGGNLGKQRPAPMMREAPQPSAPAAAPARQAQPATAPAPTAPQPKPSFMSRFGGLIAGLGLGALIGSLFGGHLGTGMGSLLLLMIVLGIGFMLFRMLGARRPATAGAASEGLRPAFSGIGSAVPGGQTAAASASIASPSIPPGFEVEPFLRVAKTSFIRLQAANDAKDLDDIRDYTTPEMYAEISMQLAERGAAPQRTEVVSLDAQLVEAVIEGDYEVASVRFSGTMREEPGAAPEPFDEIWHVRKDLRERNPAWLISGIQQVGPTPS